MPSSWNFVINFEKILQNFPDRLEKIIHRLIFHDLQGDLINIFSRNRQHHHNFHALRINHDRLTLDKRSKIADFLDSISVHSLNNGADCY